MSLETNETDRKPNVVLPAESEDPALRSPEEDGSPEQSRSMRRNQRGISFVATSPTSGSTSMSMSASPYASFSGHGGGLGVRKSSTFRKKNYLDNDEAPFVEESDPMAMSAASRVVKMRETTVTQRFNIFQERRSRSNLTAEKEESQQEKLRESVMYSRKAVKKVQKVFSKAGGICKQLYTSAMQRRANPHAAIRIHIDEYTKMCLNRSKESDTHNIHYRFCSAVDEIRSLRHELSGVYEHSKDITDRVGSILGEVFTRLCQVGGAILRGETLTSITRFSERSHLDAAFGLIIQQWENPQALKIYGKTLQRFLNYQQSPFHVPVFVAAEVCGRSFSAMSMVPVIRVPKHPLRDEWIRFFVDQATCDLHFEVDEAAVISNSRFGYGYDGRLYCMSAVGMVPEDFSDVFLEQYEGEVNRESMMNLQLRAVEHTCTELTAITKAATAEVSKSMHRHGLSVKYIHNIHAYLTRTEQNREANATTGEDTNLTDAIRSVVAEIIARVLKVLIRENFLQIKPSEDHIMAREMAVIASQLCYSQIIEGVPESDQLYMQVAAISRDLFPFNKRFKDLLWDEYFVSEEKIATRVARFTGLQVMTNVIVGASPYRFVRGVNLSVHSRRLDIVRGKHRDVLQKLVSRIKSSRAFSPYKTAGLTYTLADVFHQAASNSGITNSPSQVYQQLMQSRKKVNSTEEEGVDGGEKLRSSGYEDKKAASKDDDAWLGDDGDEVFTLDDVEIRYLLAMQAVYCFAQKRIDGRDMLTAFNRFLENNIQLVKTCEPTIFPFIMAQRVRVFAAVSRYLQDNAVVNQLESCIQTLNGMSRKTVESGALERRIDPRHTYWMWRLLYAGLALGKSTHDAAEAVDVMRQQRQHALNVFGEGSLQEIGCRTDVATQLSDMGRLKDAEEEFHEARELLETKDRTNRMLFTTCNNLGVTYFMMASKATPDKIKRRRTTFLKIQLPEDAEEYLQQAIEQFKFVLINRQWADTKQLADALNNLGSVYLFRMQYGDAVTCFEDSLALTRDYYADDHPDRQMAMKNLKACEKAMKNRAAVLIGCWVRRVRAKAQLSLLKKGNTHVIIFQRVGRGMFVRAQLHRHAEKKRIKQAQQQRIAAATAAAAARKPNRNTRDSDSPSVDRSNDSSPILPVGTGSISPQSALAAQAVVLQRYGRAYLQRVMIGELRTLRLKKEGKQRRSPSPSTFSPMSHGTNGISFENGTPEPVLPPTVNPPTGAEPLAPPMGSEENVVPVRESTAPLFDDEPKQEAIDLDLDE